MTLYHLPKPKSEELKAIFSGRCEWCDTEYPNQSLVFHLIVQDSSMAGAEPSPDPQKHILVLCRNCHVELHQIPLPYHLQKDLVRARPQKLRRAIREILGYTPPPYQPPGDFDLAEIYEECFSLRSIDLFRAGG